MFFFITFFLLSFFSPMKRKREEPSPPTSSSVSMAPLPRGIVHLPNAVSAVDLEGLLETAIQLGASSEGGFFHCNNERCKRMLMMNLGVRETGKGRYPQDIPEAWKVLARQISATASEQDPSIPLLEDPDVCVVNVYTPKSRLSMHEDVYSRKNRGIPVVSISLGLSADFSYKRSWAKKHPKRNLLLHNGDALVFGGKSRGIVHSVHRIYQCSDRAPPSILSCIASQPAKLSKMMAILRRLPAGWEQDQQQEKVVFPIRLNLNFRKR